MSTLPWILLFLGAAWATPRRWQPGALGIASCVFLGLHSPLSLLVALGLAALVFDSRCSRRGNGRRLALNVVLVVAVTIWFKAGVRLGQDAAGSLALLGLAYYALRILHYSFEVYLGRLPEHSLGMLVSYLIFFPTLIAGPIHRIEGFLRDVRRRRWDGALFALGLERILYGAAKIVILGNYLLSQKLGRMLDLSTTGEWWVDYLGLLCYGGNLYAQFAGYSDIAIGVALLAGFRIPENFDYPFLATSIGDFWKRWHMTLASWCRDYVYQPIAMASRSAVLGCVGSMLVLGLWHELSLRYCLWGLYHGLGIAVWQTWRRSRHEQDAAARWIGFANRAWGWVLTMNFVVLGFALTKAETLAEAWAIVTNILTMGSRDA